MVDCSSINYSHDLSSGRRESDWFLSPNIFLLLLSTKGPEEKGNLEKKKKKKLKKKSFFNKT
jgi:hypothetical protein